MGFFDFFKSAPDEIKTAHQDWIEGIKCLSCNIISKKKAVCPECGSRNLKSIVMRWTFEYKYNKDDTSFTRIENQLSGSLNGKWEIHPDYLPKKPIRSISYITRMAYKKK